MPVFSVIFYPYYCFLPQNTIFLILPNVKILSPLARAKMKCSELFSKNEASTRVF